MSATPVILDYLDLNPKCGYCEEPAKWIRVARFHAGEGPPPSSLAVMTLCDRCRDGERAHALLEQLPVRDGTPGAEALEAAVEKHTGNSGRVPRRLVRWAMYGLVLAYFATAAWIAPSVGWGRAIAFTVLGPVVGFVALGFTVSGWIIKAAIAERSGWTPSRLRGPAEDDPALSDRR